MKKYIILFINIFSIASVYSQIDFVTFGSRTAVATNMINPALPLQGELSFTFPGFSSFSVSAATSIAPNDFLRQQTDNSYLVDFPLLISNLKNQNGVSGNLNYQPLYISFHTKNKKGFISLGYEHIVDFKGSLSDDLLTFLGEGNAAFIDQTVTLDDETLGLIHYGKYHFNYTHFINEQLTIGARINGYGGYNHFEVEDFKASVFTDGNSFPAYATTASIDFEAKAGGMLAPVIDENDEYEFGGPGHIIGIGLGLGLDIGVNYKIDNNFSASFAARDIAGSIRWKTDDARIISWSGTGEIDFDGFETSLNAEDPGKEFEEQADDLEEELKANFDIQTVKKEYKSSIGSAFTGAVSFESDNKKHNVIGLLNGKNRFGSLDLQAAAIYHFSPAKWFQFSTGYSWSEIAPVNIGTGLTFNLKSTQLHFSTNNIIAFFNQDNIGQASFRFGINIVYPEKEEKKPEELINEAPGDGTKKPIDNKKYF